MVPELTDRPLLRRMLSEKWQPVLAGAGVMVVVSFGVLSVQSSIQGTEIAAGAIAGGMLAGFLTTEDGFSGIPLGVRVGAIGAGVVMSTLLAWLVFRVYFLLDPDEPFAPIMMGAIAWVVFILVGTIVGIVGYVLGSLLREMAVPDRYDLPVY